MEANNGRQGELLAFEGVSKLFPGVVALDGVSFSIGRGEVHGLIGENGAGKSTLIKIICGVYRPDGGVMRLEGEPVQFHSPTEAQHSGVQVMHQEIKLHGNLTVAENIYISALSGGFGLVNRKKLFQRAEELLRSLGLEELDPWQPVGELSIAKQQMVTLARIMASAPKVVLMDEPTASLTQNEVDRLFQVVRDLRERGVTVIYISHYLEEVRSISDRISVLRDGHYVGTYRTGEVSTQDLVSQIAGKELQTGLDKPKRTHGGELMRVEALASLPVVREVSFRLHSGEVLGVYGLNGAGKSETLRALYGIDRQDGGAVTVEGKAVSSHSVQAALEGGIILLPEDRRKQGLVLRLSVRENIALGNHGTLATAGVMNRTREREAVSRYIRDMRIKTPSSETQALNLSGGNQQKVVLARSMLRNMRIFLMDEPTVGIDVGARAEIYKLIEDMAHQGAGIVVASSDSGEIMEICDRAVILHQGRVAAVLEREEFSEDAMLFYAMGGVKQ